MDKAIKRFMDLCRAQIHSNLDEVAQKRKRIVDIKLRTIVGQIVPYGKVNVEYAAGYWDHINEVVDEIKKHAEFTIDGAGDLVVVRINESFSELNEILNLTGIEVSANQASSIESIIEATLRVKHSYQLLKD